MLRRQRDDPLAMAPQHRIVKHDQPGGSSLTAASNPTSISFGFRASSG